MHTEQKADPISIWFRLGGTFTGAILSALGAVVFFFVGAVLDAINGAASFPYFVGTLSFIGGVFGWLNPRQAIGSLAFFLPDLCD